jgi:hypothetical protein
MKHSIKQKQAHVIAWRQSGLSQQSYCAQHGLTLGSFKNWPKRYGIHRVCLPVNVTSATEPAGNIVLTHPDGIRVQIPAQQLTILLQALLPC